MSGAGAGAGAADATITAASEAAVDATQAALVVGIGQVPDCYDLIHLAVRGRVDHHHWPHRRCGAAVVALDSIMASGAAPRPRGARTLMDHERYLRACKRTLAAEAADERTF